MKFKHNYNQGNNLHSQEEVGGMCSLFHLCMIYFSYLTIGQLHVYLNFKANISLRILEQIYLPVNIKI